MPSRPRCPRRPEPHREVPRREVPHRGRRVPAPMPRRRLNLRPPPRRNVPRRQPSVPGKADPHRGRMNGGSGFPICHPPIGSVSNSRFASGSAAGAGATGEVTGVVTGAATAVGRLPFNPSPAKRLAKRQKKRSRAWLRLGASRVNQPDYSAMETSNALLASTFGSSTLSRPFLNSALIFPVSTPLPSWNERLNLP